MPSVATIAPLYLYPHAAANEPVVLHEGPVAIEAHAAGKGRLLIRWLPSADLLLEATLDSLDAPEPGARLMVSVANSAADVLFGSLNIRSDSSGSLAKVSGTICVFETGAGTGLKQIGFQIANFNEFRTPGPKTTPAFGYPPQVAELRQGGWLIRLTAVPESRSIFKNLGDVGGYAFTHLGRLEREDGSLFTAEKAQEILDTLRWFLCFARGAASALPIRWGISENNAVVWHYWNSPVLDVWKGRDTWFDEHHGNLLQELFSPFAQCVADAALWPPLRLALHWYQKCNTRAGGMEGAIVLGLTALDLLGGLVVVERAGAMSDSKYDKSPQKEKLAALLDALRVPQAIPPQLVELSAFATVNSWPTAGEALAEIRHGYVHPNKKRRKVVLAAPNVALFQTWQLSLWYQELAILYLLDHQGEYRNRLTAEWVGQVEQVPWA